jgi:hypothetical protein
MANLETQIVDEIIVNTRRKMMTLGGAALAGMALTSAKPAAAQSTTIGDTDILNFALNLEYLEANFYYLAAFGTTIDVANTFSTAAGAPVLPGTGTMTRGTVVSKTPITCKVAFASSTNAGYAIETAVEEGKHVKFLAGALGSVAVAQPQIDLMGSFNTLYAAASGTAGATFDPFTTDFPFLAGAYIFEDVGVSAYHGAASLFSQGTTGKTYLQAAAGILAVEAYHAGLVRTAIQLQDTNGNYIALTQAVSALRAKLSMAAGPSATAAAAAYDPYPDDYGLPLQSVSLNGTSGLGATRLTDADSNYEVAFARNTQQVLNIVTGGGAGTAAAPVSPAKGVFFPNGLNGLIK